MNKYGFKFKNENDELIDCELLLSFFSKSLNKNFMIFTDNTKDDDDNLKAYMYYILDEVLYPVVDNEEIKIVSEVYNKIKNGGNING